MRSEDVGASEGSAVPGVRGRIRVCQGGSEYAGVGAEQWNQTRKRVIRTVESVGSAIVGQGEGRNEQRVEHECGRRKGTAKRLLSALNRAFKVPDTDE